MVNVEFPVVIKDEKLSVQRTLGISSFRVFLRSPFPRSADGPTVLVRPSDSDMNDNTACLPPLGAVRRTYRLIAAPPHLQIWGHFIIVKAIRLAQW